MKFQSIMTLALAASSAATANDTPQWPQFLGPSGTATAAGPLTVDFALRDVAWRTPLPTGSSSPCIHGDRLFVTGADAGAAKGEGGGELVMLGFDRKTGAELWRRTVETPGLGPTAHIDADPAASTACTDGERVVFYFGGHGLIATDLDGQVIWDQTLPVPKAPFGLGTSPILLGDNVILSRDGCEDSGIFAFSKYDGEPDWQVPRVGHTFSHGTPFVWNNSQRKELIVGGTQRLTSLDPENGRPLWEVGGLTTLVCTTPTADSETLYFAGWSTPDAERVERSRFSLGGIEFTEEELIDGHAAFNKLDKNGDGQIERDEMPDSRAKDAWAFCDQNQDGVVVPEELLPMLQQPKGKGNNRLIAVKAGGSGDITKTHVKWSRKRGLPYVASPLLHQGRLYMIKAGGLLTCVDAQTGEPHFDRHRLDDRSEYYATPIGIGDHVIICSSAGTIFVIKAADQFELVTNVDLGERIVATPAVVDGTVYVRSRDALWAFGE